MMSQMRHDNNEKNVESIIVQCTTTVQNRIIFFSLWPQLFYLLFQIDIYQGSALGYLSAKRSRTGVPKPGGMGGYIPPNNLIVSPQ